MGDTKAFGTEFGPANLYFLIETAKANGLDSQAYLRRLITELPKAEAADDIEQLLPFKL